jgi:L-amino acid N-acyltransferase YncA
MESMDIKILSLYSTKFCIKLWWRDYFTYSILIGLRGDFMDISFKLIESSEKFSDTQILDKLAKILCYDEPELLDNSKNFWNDWLSNKISGAKITLVAEVIDEDDKQLSIGVVRFWETPYCGNKWFVEGFEVISPWRRKGIGKLMIEYGLETLKGMGLENVYANISNKNIPSIRLHESLGFCKVSSGALNSYGQYRENADRYEINIKE